MLEGVVEVHGGLAVHPELRRGLEFAGKQNRRLCRNAALAIDQSIDPLDGNFKAACNLHLSHPLGDQKLMEQHFSGSSRPSVFWNHRISLVII